MKNVIGAGGAWLPRPAGAAGACPAGGGAGVWPAWAITTHVPRATIVKADPNRVIESPPEKWSAEPTESLRILADYCNS
jgi:hypothetical protein